MRPSFLSRCQRVVIPFVFVAGTASAQPAPEPSRLDPVVVVAKRFPEPAAEAPIGLTVVTREDIRRSSATTLPELLSEQNGVVIRDLTGSPDQQIDLRGFGISGDQNTLVLLNGQRATEVELSSVGWSAIPLASIDRIEILRGAGAVLYGSGATGGTINIVTRGPTPGMTTGAVSGSVGSYATRSIAANASVASDRVGLSLDANRYQADNYRRNNRVEQENLQGEVRSFLDRGFVALRFGREAQDLRLPGPRTVGQLTTDPRGPATPGDYATRDGNRAVLSVVHDIAFGRVEADFGYRDVDRTSFQKDYSGFGSNTFTVSRVSVWSMSPRLQMPYSALGARHNLIIGFDWYDWDATQRRANDQASIGAPAAFVLSTQRTSAFYAQNTTYIGAATTLSLGLREERFTQRSRDAAATTAYASGSMTRSPVAWEAGLRQGLTERTSVYGRIGKSYRYATIDEVYSQYGGPFYDPLVTLLEPQASRDHEIGAEYRRGGGRLRASYFLYDLDNEIYYFAPSFSNINLPPTRRQGVELDARAPLAATIATFASYTATDASFRDGVIGGVDVRGKEIPLVPRATAAAGFAWRVVPSTQITGLVRHVGRQRYDNDQSNTFALMPSYTLVDLKLTHTVGRLHLGFAVNNLFDRNYYSYGIRSLFSNTYNAYPQRGRAVVASAEYRF